MGAKRMDEKGSLVKIPRHIWKYLQNETIEQIKGMDWLRENYPDYAKLTMHIPNERKQKPIWGYILRLMGLLKGASDLFMAAPAGEFHGLFVEVKTKKGRLTENQKQFLRDMEIQGYKTAVAFGAEELIKIFKDYLKLAETKNKDREKDKPLN